MPTPRVGRSRSSATAELCDQLRARAHAELVKYRRHLVRNRAWRAIPTVRDLLVGLATDQRRKYRLLARGQGSRRGELGLRVAQDHVVIARKPEARGSKLARRRLGARRAFASLR